MAQAREGGVVEGVAAAGAALGVHALEYAHLVAEAPFFKAEHGADAGGEVGCVRLELTGGEGLGKALARFQPLYHCVRLVAVGDYQLVFIAAHCGVDYEAGVLHLGGVEGLRKKLPVLQGKDAVAAVCAAAHDEIGGDRLAFRAASGHYAPAHIGIALYKLGNAVYLVYVHVTDPFLL